MKGIWQAMVILSLGVSALHAQKLPDDREWKALNIVKSAFSRKIGLMDAEREQYAAALSGLAIKQIHDSKGSKASLKQGRKLMALALHLSPRNKQTVIANVMLTRGNMPREVKPEYSMKGFARVLLTRSELLTKQGGEENELLARYFIGMAVELDPENEDAIYLSEVRRLDHGELNWSKLTDPAVRRDR